MAVGAMISFLSGCYERVVGAKGVGASYADVQSEYRSNTALDRAWDSMFTPAKPQNRAERWTDPDMAR